MKKKMLIGLAVIGATVSMLCGCSSSDTNGSNNNNNNSTRETFASDTPQYQINTNEGYITVKIPDEWYPDRDYANSPNESGITYIKAEIPDDGDVRISFHPSEIGGNRNIEALKQEFTDYIKRYELTSYRIIDSNINGFEALYVEAPVIGTAGLNGDWRYEYAVPLSNGLIEITLECPNDEKLLYSLNFDKMVHSIEIPSNLKP